MNTPIKLVLLFLAAWLFLYSTIDIRSLDHGNTKPTSTLNTMLPMWNLCEAAISDHTGTWAEKQLAIDELIARHDTQFILDGWGNKLRFLVIKKEIEEEWSPSVFVYSNGEDGISLTEGKDPDDISLWNHPAIRDMQSQVAKNGFNKEAEWKTFIEPNEFYYKRRDSWESGVWRTRILRSMIFALAIVLAAIFLKKQLGFCIPWTGNGDRDRKRGTGDRKPN